MKSEEQRIKERILRLGDVKARTGLSRSTIYLGVKTGNFPKPVSIGVRCVGWAESQIDLWIQEKIQSSHQ